MKRLLFLVFLLPLCARAQGLNNPNSDTFATCLIRDNKGDWWAGADDKGLVYRDARGQWVQAGGQEELGDSNVTCIAVDAAHRVWGGTGSAGVAVFDGKAWKRYNVWNGPLANRINDLEVDETGAVWGATDAGVFRWSDKDGWQYPGVFESGPNARASARRPAYSLAIESPTSVLAATDEGLNRLVLLGGNRVRVETPGRADLPVQPTRSQGEGFLPGPVHAVALDSQKQIWCATRYGVCVSKNAGVSWRFLRGADWQANVKGSAARLTPDATNAPGDPLAEDWVTTLAPTSDARMWLGFRQKGAEERDCRTLELLVTTRDDPKFATSPAFGGDWITAIVPLGGDGAVFARYGGGLGSLFGVNLEPSTENRDWNQAALPEDATSPEEFVKELASDLEKRAPLKAGEAAFYSLDRETRGDWPLRYGNEGGEIMGAYDDKARLVSPEFALDLTTGPHRAGAEADCYVYAHEMTSTKPNVVQMPWLGIRRQSEVNDGTWQGGKYPYSFDGPGLWSNFAVPAGLHRVSFYWYNKDAHSGDNRMRDHLIQLYPGELPQEQCFLEKPLTTARLWNGWNGEYASFVVSGPAKFQAYIPRDRSKGTISQAIFFDRLGALATKPAWLPERIQLPPKTELETGAPLSAALALWNACDSSETRGVPCRIERLMALRAAKAGGAPDDALATWRIQAGVWDDAGKDREALALPPSK